MLTHLIILLDDTSISFCHYDTAKERQLIPLDTLRAGIIFAMKENLNVQFVYPDYELPKEYLDIIESIDHVKIKPYGQREGADVIILSDWNICLDSCIEGKTCIINVSRGDLKDGLDEIKSLLGKVARLNIVLTDIEMFRDEEADEYSTILSELSCRLIELYAAGKNIQLNLLTDRLILKEMNNCGAGDTTITLAPNGHFFICPAFYYDSPEDNSGNLEDGLNIKNHQLLCLSHAPICCHCDAFQCKRCVWLNYKLTMDVNTPSHQQCVIAHLERNASRNLLLQLKERGLQLLGTHEISKIDYLDPFNNLKKWR